MKFVAVVTETPFTAFQGSTILADRAVSLFGISFEFGELANFFASGLLK